MEIFRICATLLSTRCWVVGDKREKRGNAAEKTGSIDFELGEAISTPAIHGSPAGQKIMSAVAIDESGNVLHALASRARATRIPWLVALTLFGAAGSVAVLVFIPVRWLFSFPGAAVSAFGLWGLIEAFITAHVLRFSNLARGFLRRLQKAVAAIGVIAAFGTLFALFGKVLGAFIS